MRLPELNAKPENLCVNTHALGYNNPLKYFTPYSLSACREECQINHELSLCGCASHLHGGNNVEVCPYVVFSNCSLQARDEYMADPSIEANCDCHPECKETIYDVYISSTGINDDSKTHFLKTLNIPELNINNFDKNIVSLKIFFGEMRYTLIEQQCVYT